MLEVYPEGEKLGLCEGLSLGVFVGNTVDSNVVVDGCWVGSTWLS